MTSTLTKVSIPQQSIDFEYNLVSSPLNYIGGKFKLLPQILPLFPKEINNFVDMFCGGLNVAANIKAKNVYALRTRCLRNSLRESL